MRPLWSLAFSAVSSSALLSCGRANPRTCFNPTSQVAREDGFEESEGVAMAGGFVRYQVNTARTGMWVARLPAADGVLELVDPVPVDSGELVVTFGLRNDTATGQVSARLSPDGGPWVESDSGLPDLTTARPDWTLGQASFSLATRPASARWQLEVTGAGTGPVWEVLIDDVQLRDRQACGGTCNRERSRPFESDLSSSGEGVVMSGGFALSESGGDYSAILPTGGVGVLQPAVPVAAAGNWALVDIELVNSGGSGRMAVALSLDGGTTFGAEVEPADLSTPRVIAGMTRARFELPGEVPELTFAVRVEDAPADFAIEYFTLEVGTSCPGDPAP